MKECPFPTLVATPPKHVKVDNENAFEEKQISQFMGKRTPLTPMFLLEHPVHLVGRLHSTSTLVLRSESTVFQTC